MTKLPWAAIILVLSAIMAAAEERTPAGAARPIGVMVSSPDAQEHKLSLSAEIRANTDGTYCVDFTLANVGKKAVFLSSDVTPISTIKHKRPSGLSLGGEWPRVSVGTQKRFLLLPGTAGRKPLCSEVFRGTIDADIRNRFDVVDLSVYCAVYTVSPDTLEVHVAHIHLTNTLSFTDEKTDGRADQ